MLLNALQARRLFTLALDQKFAILAVNADSPSAVVDCLEAALICRAPIIIETSLWQLKGRSFGVGDARLGLARYIADLTLLAESPRFRNIPVILHTDHIKGPETFEILSAAIRGLPLVFGGREMLLRPGTLSLDSSEMSEDENIAMIGAICRVAGECGEPVTLEMEAGVDNGVTDVKVAERLIQPVERLYPESLALWAPGVGTQHGFSDKGYPFSSEAVRQHREAASQICGRPIGIALHGSSGLAASDLIEGIAAGIVKVNWSSESLLIRSQAAREYYSSHSALLEKTHKDFKTTAMDNGVQTFVSTRYIPRVTERIRLLGGEDRCLGFLQSVRS